MRKVLCCCTVFSFMSVVLGNAVDKPQKDDCNGKCLTAKDYEGASVGVGFNVGIQKAVAEANREFRNTSTSVRSTNFGGTITLGWQKNVCGNCFVGVEGGIDFGSSKSVAVGGVLKDDSWVVLEEERRRGVLASMLGEISNSITPPDVIPPATEKSVIDNNSWRNLVDTFRYIGNAPGTAGADGMPALQNVRDFIISPSNGIGVYSYDVYVAGGINAECPNAQLADFIPNTVGALNQLGRRISGETRENFALLGIREIRDYISRRHPNLALVLQSIATNNIGTPPSNNIYSRVSCCLSEFLRAHLCNGEYIGADLPDVGIPENTLPGNTRDEQLKFAGDALYSLYYPQE